jgi:hypothetical protein
MAAGTVVAAAASTGLYRGLMNLSDLAGPFASSLDLSRVLHAAFSRFHSPFSFAVYGAFRPSERRVYQGGMCIEEGIIPVGVALLAVDRVRP